jgi:hypothetical protein
MINGPGKYSVNTGRSEVTKYEQSADFR